MARFVKPTLDVRAPDPLSLSPGRSARALPARTALSGPVVGGALPAGAAHDDERRRFSRPVVRDRRVESDDVGVRHHRHVPGRAVARHSLRAAPPLHGRDRRRVSLVGIRARAGPARFPTRSRRRRARPASRSAPSAGVRRISVTQRPRDRRRARERRRNRGPIVSSSVDPRLTFTKFIDARELPDEFVDEVRRYKFRGSSGKVNLALDGLPELHQPARATGATCVARFRSLRAWTTWSALTTRRSTDGTRAAVHRHRHSRA